MYEKGLFVLVCIALILFAIVQLIIFIKLVMS